MLRQAKITNASQGLLGFDAHYKVLSGQSNNKGLDYSSMGTLCVKVAAYSLYKQNQTSKDQLKRNGSEASFKFQKPSINKLQRFPVKTNYGDL